MKLLNFIFKTLQIKNNNQYGLPDGIEDSSELNLAVQLNKIPANDFKFLRLSEKIPIQ